MQLSFQSSRHDKRFLTQTSSIYSNEKNKGLVMSSTLHGKVSRTLFWKIPWTVWSRVSLGVDRRPNYISEKLLENSIYIRSKQGPMLEFICSNEFFVSELSEIRRTPSFLEYDIDTRYNRERSNCVQTILLLPLNLAFWHVMQLQ